MRAFLRGLVAVVLMLTLLAACGADRAPVASEARTVDRATVTDSSTGPVLCTGPVRESAPPQCEGPIISNWDWDKVWGAYGEAGAQFGEFCFEGKDVGDTFELTTAPRPVGTCDAQEYLGSATVLEDGGTFGAVHGPQLCLGAIMSSAPAQCSAPDIPNWDWDKVVGESRRSKTIDGPYVVHGVYVDGDFTLTRPPVPADEYNGELPNRATNRDFTTPCPEPEEGWFPDDHATLGEGSADRAASFASKLDTYSEVWLDQQFNDGTENDDNRIILNVRVTRDVKGAETVMRTIWAGALCVSEAKHSAQELNQIQDEAGKRAKGLMLSSSSGDDHVDLDVIVDEGDRLQTVFDNKYGVGTVRVSSALSAASPGL